MKAKEITINRRYTYHAIHDLKTNENDSYYYLSDLQLAHPFTERNTIVLKDGHKAKGTITIEIRDTEAQFTFSGEDETIFTQVLSVYSQAVPDEFAHYVDDRHLVKEELLHSPKQTASLRKSSMPTMSGSQNPNYDVEPTFYGTEPPHDYSPTSDPLLDSSTDSSPDKKLSSQLRRSALFTIRQDRASSGNSGTPSLRPIKSRSVPDNESGTGLAIRSSSPTTAQSPQRLFSMSTGNKSVQEDSSQGLKLLKVKPRKLSFQPSDSPMPNSRSQHSEDKYHIENITSQYKGFGENPLYDSIVFFHALLDPVIYQDFNRHKDKKLTEVQHHLLNSAHQEMRALKRAKRKKSLATSNSPESSTRLFERNRSNPSLVAEAENRLSSIVTQNLVISTLEDNSILTLIFRSFGAKKIELVKIIDVDLLIQLLDSNPEEVREPALRHIHMTLAKNKEKIGPLYIQIIAHCFAVKEYNPATGSDEFSRWFRLFILVMRISPHMPPIFSDSDALNKFLSALTPNNMSSFAHEIREKNLGENFSHGIVHRFVYKKDIRLARIILNRKNSDLKNILKETCEEHFYFSLLSLKNKAIDLLLLKDPEFIIFIRGQTTLVGRYLYAEYLERLKSAFDYKNLPRDGENSTDVRHTQSGESLLKRGINILRKMLSNKFLSSTEINQLFWGQEIPVNKLGRGEEWLKYYRENLSLLLSAFLPHLPQHLAELDDIYEEFYNQTMGKLTSLDYSRYNPEDHSLSKFPSKMTQYLVGNKYKVDQFNANLLAMGELYGNICALSNGTVRFNNNEQSGFRPITLVADNILSKLETINPCATSFKRYNLAAAISLFITDFCRANFKTESELEGICTTRTLADVSGLEPEKLWLHSELSVTLLQLFQTKIDEMKKLNQNTLPNDCFTEDVVIGIIHSLMNQISLMKIANMPDQLHPTSLASSGLVNL